MKTLFACAILFAGPVRAQPGGNCKVIDCPGDFTPKPVTPSIAARTAVLEALAGVKDANKFEEKAEKGLAAQQAVIRLRLEKNIPWYKPWTVIDDSDLLEASRSDAKYLSLQDNFRLAVVESYKAHNKAIREATIAYQLVPPVTDFTGDPRAAGVNMVAKPWLPRYSRHEKLDETTGLWRKRNPDELKQEQLENAIVGGGVNAAQTRGDGVLEFYGQAFASPEDLAILIYHETSHWVDVAGKSGGFKRSDPPSVACRTEQHAYEGAAVFAEKIGADPEWHRKRAVQFKNQATIAEKENLTKEQIIASPRFKDWIGKNWAGRLAMAPAESELSSGDETLLKKAMAEAQAAVLASRQAEESRRKMEELEQRQVESAIPIPYLGPGQLPEGMARAVPLPPGQSGAIPVPVKAGPQIIRAMRKVAQDSCANPPLPFERLLGVIPWSEFHQVQDEPAQEAGLSACELRVYRRLTGFGRSWQPGQTIGPDEVRAAVAAPPSPPSSGGGSEHKSRSHDEVWRRLPNIRR